MWFFAKPCKTNAVMYARGPFSDFGSRPSQVRRCLNNGHAEKNYAPEASISTTIFPVVTCSPSVTLTVEIVPETGAQ